jgi:hypothetical protein
MVRGKRRYRDLVPVNAFALTENPSLKRIPCMMPSAWRLVSPSTGLTCLEKVPVVRTRNATRQAATGASIRVVRDYWKSDGMGVGVGVGVLTMARGFR